MSGVGAPPELGGAAYPEPDWDTGEPEPLGIDPATADPADAGDPGACAHPAPERRLVDSPNGGKDQMCLACGQVLDDRVPQPAIIPKDRPGGADPTAREGDARSGGLRHVTGADVVGGPRPYTPDEVEREIVDTLDRIERGVGWLTTKEEERAAAKLAYERKFARARWASTARSAEQRNDEALLACMEEYEQWQLLELVCRTAREGMHNLRSKLSGLQSVLRSISAALGGGGGYR